MKAITSYTLYEINPADFAYFTVDCGNRIIFGRDALVSTTSLQIKQQNFVQMKMLVLEHFFPKLMKSNRV